MRKGIFIRIMALLLLLCLAPLAALAADTPKPIPVLSEEEIPATPVGVHHYMLICVDSWAANPKNLGHTDGLILVTVDEFAKRVMLTSFIRDMLIQRPDGDFGRINNIVTYFGKNQEAVEKLVATINSHFGLRIEDYIVVDFSQVQNIVDAVGGVDITVTANEASYLKRYAISSTSTTPAMGGAGTYHFTGHAAVIYMRIRKVLNSDGESQDVGRTRRARTVLTSIADSLKSITEEEAFALLDVVMANTVMSNMTTADLFEALNIALSLRGTPIEQIRMPVDGTYELMPVAGMATQQIDYEANRQALDDFLFNTFIVRSD